MANRRSGNDRNVRLEHAFDRLLAVKLEQVYGVLVPEQVCVVGVGRRVRATAFTHFACADSARLILHDFCIDGERDGGSGWSFGSFW